MAFLRRPRRLLPAALLCLLLGGSGLVLGAVGAVAQDGRSRVLVTTLDDMIGPVTADQITDGVARATDEGYDAYVLRMNTPGGLDTSMRQITSAFLEAEVPVVVHVAPRGARAASAGAIITYAAHIAAMAPGTAIGAATPVDLEGGDVARKIVNDAAALAESIAQARDRPVDFAVDSVRKGRSASANEALELGVVDLIAGSLDELLDEVDGTEVTLASGAVVTLRTAGAAVDTFDLGLFRRILKTLADPNLAFLFLSIGTLGVIYELASPGIGAGGIIGASLIVLAMFSLSVLAVDVTGLLFLALAVALFAAEVFAPGIGVFAVLGAASLVLSGVFLFDDAAAPGVSIAVLLPTALVVGGLVVVAGRLAMRAQRGTSSTTGAGVLEGKVVTVRRGDGVKGQALVEGGWWTLRSADAPLFAGDEVKVVAVEGLELVVTHVTPAPAGRPASAGPTTEDQTTQQERHTDG
ncbi:MAG TPA: NfeD family protein [Acidimicrobiales bacterium]|nr:NfeD family protein [Acidimicrobiales bacterium]